MGKRRNPKTKTQMNGETRSEKQVWKLWGGEREGAGNHSKQRLELLHRQSGLAEDRTERSFCHLVVVRHRETPERRGDMPEDNVTAPLVVSLVPGFPQGLDHLTA